MSPTTASRPSPTRERLIVEALELFHARSYHATGIQEIVAAAAVPKGSFYHHFTNKQDLAVAALQRYAEANPTHLLDDPTRSPRDRLRAYFGALGQEFAASGRTRGCMMGNFTTELADGDSTVRAVLARLFTGWVQRVATAIDEGQRDGTISKSPAADVLAESLISLWEGSLIQARATSSDQPVSTFFDLAFNHLIAPPTSDRVIA